MKAGVNDYLHYPDEYQESPAYCNIENVYKGRNVCNLNGLPLALQVREEKSYIIRAGLNFSHYNARFH